MDGEAVSRVMMRRAWEEVQNSQRGDRGGRRRWQEVVAVYAEIETEPLAPTLRAWSRWRRSRGT